MIRLLNIENKNEIYESDVATIKITKYHQNYHQTSWARFCMFFSVDYVVFHYKKLNHNSSNGITKTKIKKS